MASLAEGSLSNVGQPVTFQRPASTVKRSEHTWQLAQLSKTFTRMTPAAFFTGAFTLNSSHGQLEVIPLTELELETLPC